MKRLQMFIVATLLLTLSPAGAWALPLRAPITQVTVYRDMAEILRACSLSLEAGSHRLPLEDLPALLREDSVQITLKGPATLEALEIRRAFTTQSPQERAKALEEKIRRLEAQVRDLDLEKDALREKLHFLKVLWGKKGREASSNLPDKIPDPTELKAFMGFLLQETRETLSAMESAESQKQAFQKRISALRKELAQISPPVKRETKIILLDLQVKAPSPVHLEIRYLVGRASWRPRYRARVSADLRRAAWTLLGEVRQQSGEEWSGVRLLLSTATPALGTTAPKLPPWYLNLAPEPRPLKAGEERGSRDTAFMMPPQTPTEKEARLLPAETTVRFAVPYPVTIPSEAVFHKVFLAEKRLDGVFTYVTVPKLSPKAYLRASLTNAASLPLLGGSVSVYFGSLYVGEGRISTTAPGQRFDLDLGPDEAIRVERKLVLREEGEGGLLSSEKVLRYRYLIEVESFKERSVRLQVVDQIPVSQNEAIKVKDVILEPTPTKVGEDGIVLWELDLSPKVKKEFILGFSIRHPRDRRLILQP